MNSELFVSSRQVYGIDVIGPLRGDNHWEAKAGVGFAARDFVIDWQRQVATFPHGKLSSSWTPAVDKFRNHVIKIKFGKTECQDCPVNAMHPHNTDQAYHHHTAASAARGIASGTTP